MKNKVFIIGGGASGNDQNIAEFMITGSNGGGVPIFPLLQNYDNDTSASLANVPLGGLYRSGSQVKIRIV